MDNILIIRFAYIRPCTIYNHNYSFIKILIFMKKKEFDLNFAIKLLLAIYREILVKSTSWFEWIACRACYCFNMMDPNWGCHTPVAAFMNILTDNDKLT